MLAKYLDAKQEEFGPLRCLELDKLTKCLNRAPDVSFIFCFRIAPCLRLELKEKKLLELGSGTCSAWYSVGVVAQSPELMTKFLSSRFAKAQRRVLPIRFH